MGSWSEARSVETGVDKSWQTEERLKLLRTTSLWRELNLLEESINLSLVEKSSVGKRSSL